MRELQRALITVADREFLPGLERLDKSISERNSMHGVQKVLISDDIEAFRDYRVIKPDEKLLEGIDCRSRFKKAFYKLLLFGMVEYDKILFVDSDVLCLGDIQMLLYGYNNMDFYAAKDDGVQLDNKYNSEFMRINSGVMVVNRIMIRPDVFTEIMSIARENISYDGGDQGVINEYLYRNNVSFGYLPQIYNTLKRIYHHHKELWVKIHEDIRLLHYVGAKPWAGGDEENYAELNRLWEQT